jgi:hypothetical protein
MFQRGKCVRYFFLVMLASAALYAVVRVGGTGTEFVLVDAGDSTGSITSPDFSFWFLTAVAGLTIVSLCRFVVFGIPSMIGVWYESQKEWIYTLAFAGLAFGAYYFM